MRPALVLTLGLTLLWASCALAQIGACCLPQGACEDGLTSNECDALNASSRIWAGFRSRCYVGLCPYILTPFIDELPLPPAKQATSPGQYDMEMLEFAGTLHSELAPTRLWGYDGMSPGPTIHARTNVTVTLRVDNNLRYLENGTLRTTGPFPTVECLHGPDFWGSAPRTIVHLHGTHAITQSDGNPDFDYPPGSTYEYVYSNEQIANTLWYHDHALGRTRHHVYMGLAGFYLVHDAVDDSLGLPSGEFDVPLWFADRVVDSNSQLYYPPTYVDMWFGHYMMVNGRIQPKMSVAQAMYRLRLLNGCNQRLLRFSLFVDSQPDAAVPFVLIGTDHGLLPGPPRTLVMLEMGVSERYEIVVDFSGYAVGTTLTLRNVDDPTDTSPAGGLYVGVTDVLRFVVSSNVVHTAPVVTALPATLRPRELLDAVLGDEPSVVASRYFKLQFVSGSLLSTAGCSEAASGQAAVLKFQLGNAGWDMIEALPELGTREEWEFENPMAMHHPIHVHLVPGVIVERRWRNDTLIPLAEQERDALKDVWTVPPNQRMKIRFWFYGTYVGRFAYHCHLLEHEDHEMMRQFRLHHPFRLCNDNGVCGANEDCVSCPNDCRCASGAVCGNGLCEAGDGENCHNCGADCWANSTLCCGAPLVDSCAEPACSTGGHHCRSKMRTPACCGDGHCEGGETAAACPIDCAPQPVVDATPSPSAAPGTKDPSQSGQCVMRLTIDPNLLFGMPVAQAQQQAVQEFQNYLRDYFGGNLSIDRIHLPETPFRGDGDDASVSARGVCVCLALLAAAVALALV